MLAQLAAYKSTAVWFQSEEAKAAEVYDLRFCEKTVCLYFRQKYSICVCMPCRLSLVAKLCSKWLTVALAAGLDPLWGENILALHKFLTRFQIADISILFSAPVALN